MFAEMVMTRNLIAFAGTVNIYFLFFIYIFLTNIAVEHDRFQILGIVTLHFIPIQP
jgi:hypothetical protein